MSRVINLNEETVSVTLTKYDILMLTTALAYGAKEMDYNGLPELAKEFERLNLHLHALGFEKAE